MDKDAKRKWTQAEETETAGFEGRDLWDTKFWWSGKLLVHWEVSRALYIQDFELSLVTKTMGIKELKIVSKTGSAKQWKPYRIKNNKYKRSGRRLRVYGDSIVHATRWCRPNVAGGPLLGFGDVEWWHIVVELSLPAGFRVPENFDAQVWQLVRLLWNNCGTWSDDVVLQSHWV